MTNISPVAQIISVCVKYKILDHVRNTIQTGKIPSKDQWKYMVLKVINDLEFSSWRLDTKMYHHLLLFRTVILKIEPCVWWNVAKAVRGLKPACCTMVRLLSSCNCLRLNKDVITESHQRICVHCELQELENEEHFVMRCSSFSFIRQNMFESIFNNVAVETRDVLNNIPVNIVFYILMGMTYPICENDIMLIRIISSFHVNKMYKSRSSLE